MLTGGDHRTYLLVPELESVPEDTQGEVFPFS